ncbi:hypothetical protein Tco_0456256 [Tanacetum coccineum]
MSYSKTRISASKDLDQLLGSQITDKSKKGLGYSAVPPPHPLIYNRPNKLDLSYSGLEEFQEPEFEGYGPKTSKSASEDISNEVRKSNDAPLVEKLVSDDKSEKKIVFPTVAKIEFVKSKQQEKPVRKPVKYAEMYRSQKPRGNQRNWNNQKSQQLGNDFVMHNKACYVCGSFDHLQYTCKQKRQLNGQREEKPVWNNARRVNHQNSPRITHPNPKRHMVPRKILTRSVMAWVPKKVRFSYLQGNPETELEDSVRLNSPEDKKSNIDAAQPKLMLLVNIVNAD